VTTARDLAKLARAVIKDYPEYISYWSMFNAKIGKIFIGSHNGLLRTFDGADGMKTGFICDSGFNVVASATRDGRQIMAVVLGEATGGKRTVRAANLLEHGFQTHSWKQLFNHSQNIDTMPIAMDAKAVTSVRKNVLSFECGTVRARPKKKKKKEVDGSAASAPVVVPAASEAAGAGN
jgi:D-alanyl-D-alanine carboxypeptidase